MKFTISETNLVYGGTTGIYIGAERRLSTERNSVIHIQFPYLYELVRFLC